MSGEIWGLSALTSPPDSPWDNPPIRRMLEALHGVADDWLRKM
ncbi:hypothetical protein ACFZCU_26155 [Streptomyces canus]